MQCHSESCQRRYKQNTDDYSHVKYFSYIYADTPFLEYTYSPLWCQKRTGIVSISNGGRNTLDMQNGGCSSLSTSTAGGRLQWHIPKVRQRSADADWFWRAEVYHQPTVTLAYYRISLLSLPLPETPTWYASSPRTPWVISELCLFRN